MKAENNVDLSKKICLTVSEASKLSGISVNRIRRMIDDPGCSFVVRVGDGNRKRLIKRVEFEAYISSVTDI